MLTPYNSEMQFRTVWNYSFDPDVSVEKEWFVRPLENPKSVHDDSDDDVELPMIVTPRRRGAGLRLNPPKRTVDNAKVTPRNKAAERKGNGKAKGTFTTCVRSHLAFTSDTGKSTAPSTRKTSKRYDALSQLAALLSATKKDSTQQKKSTKANQSRKASKKTIAGKVVFLIFQARPDVLKSLRVKTCY